MQECDPAIMNVIAEREEEREIDRCNRIERRRELQLEEQKRIDFSNMLQRQKDKKEMMRTVLSLSPTQVVTSLADEMQMENSLL